MQKTYKSKTLSQLKKAEGMIKKVIGMVEANKYCIDLLQQNLAVIGMLKSVNKMILENHLNSCFKKGMQSPSPKKQKNMINELLRIMDKV